MRQLNLYTRTGCHLCEDMSHQLNALAADLGFVVDAIDIDEDDDLVESFGSRVPVLMMGAEFICEYFLDEQALRDALNRGR